TQELMAPTADDSVEHRKCLAIGFDFHREFGEDRAISGADFLGECGVFRWIKSRQSRANHRDRATFSREGALMRRRVNSTRESTNDCQTGVGQLIRKFLSRFGPVVSRPT